MQNNTLFKVIELSKDSVESLWKMRFDFFQQHRKPSDGNYADTSSYRESILKALEKNNSSLYCSVLLDNHLMASFSTQLIEDEDKNSKLMLNILIEENGFSRNFLETVLSFIAEKIKGEYSLKITINCTIDDELRSYFKLTTDLVVDVCVLKRENLNISQLNAWKVEAEKLNPELEMRFYNELPDELCDEYADLFTELLNDMPIVENKPAWKITGEETRAKEQDLAKNGVTIYRLLLFTKDNQMIAKCNVRFLKSSFEYPYQFMTGVKKEYRGRMIGKWFKAIMYPKIFADFPEVKGIVSEMIPHNHYIQNINKQVGYQKIGCGGEYLLSKEDYKFFSNMI